MENKNLFLLTNDDFKELEESMETNICGNYYYLLEKFLDSAFKWAVGKSIDLICNTIYESSKYHVDYKYVSNNDDPYSVNQIVQVYKREWYDKNCNGYLDSGELISDWTLLY